MGSVLKRGGWWQVRLVSLLSLMMVTLSLASCNAGTSTVSSSVVLNSGPPDRSAGAFTTYPVSTLGGSPEAIVVGPDGNLWFTELNRGRVGYLNPQGQPLREFALPDVTAASYALTVGPDKNLWFTNSSLGKIGFVTTAGKFRQFPLSSPFARPVGIAAGPVADNALWFTESAANIGGQIVPAIGRITTSGTITEYPIRNLSGGAMATPTSVPQMIVRGPDDKMWFTDAGNNTISSITMAGSITQYPIPTANSRPFSIIAGKANDLWFTEQNAIGHFSIATGTITDEYPLPTSGSGVRGLALGPDGSVWCSQFQSNSLSKLLLPAGSFTTYPLEGNGERPDQMVLGPDGLLWFTAPGSNSIDAFALP
ncbi:MAG: hypothetical protein H0X24_11740 [Ktedonobacterales bacterium]|nr:hypothetical protein [Ktedonobacterales bacterium]